MLPWGSPCATPFPHWVASRAAASREQTTYRFRSRSGGRSIHRLKGRRRMFVAPNRSRPARGQAPPLVVGTLLVASLVLRCASTDVSATGASRVKEAGASGQLAAETGGAPPVDSAPWPVSPEGQVGSGGQEGIGNASLNYLCESGIVDKDCPLPASFCENDATLASFGDARCVGGACQWTRRTTTCPNGCRNGACGRPPAQAAEAGAVIPCPPGDAGGCELPPSMCLNSFRLLYFMNPSCLDGMCRFDAIPQSCATGRCQNGACQGFLTH